MLQGGGSLFLGSSGRMVGPGHFGLLDVGDGVQKFSCHYEADLDRGGISVLDIRPLLWRDGWPVAGDNVGAGTTGSNRRARARHWNSRSKACRSADAAGSRRRCRRSRRQCRRGARSRHRRRRRSRAQEAAQVAANWPADAVDARLSPTWCRRSRSGRSTPVANAGGYPGSPYFRISVAGTERSLAATSEGELTVLPTFTGCARATLADRSARRRNVSTDAENGAWAANASMALSAIGGSSPTLERIDAGTDRQRWLLRTP